MTARRRLVVACVLVSGCSIPPRDNPDDPANQPDPIIAELAIFDGTSPSTSFAITSPEITLSADGSTPFGEGLVVSFFQRRSVFLGEPEPPWTPVNDEPVPIGERLPIAWDETIPPVIFPTSDGDSVATTRREVRAVVSDPTGRFATAEAVGVVELINTRPTVSIDPYREVPPGGQWWEDPALPHQLTLRPDFVDPDAGDVRVVEWEQIRGPTVSTCAQGPLPATCTGEVDGSLSVSAPIDDATLQFRVTVSDGVGQRASAETTLSVQPVIWQTTLEGTIIRIPEPAYSRVLARPSFVVGASLGADGTHQVWTVESDGSPGSWQVVRRTLESSADLVIDSGVPLASGLDGVSNGGTITDDGSLWVAFANTSGNTWLRHVSPQGTILANIDGTAGQLVPAYNPSIPAAPRSVAAAPSGGLWMLRGPAGSPSLARVTAGGIVTAGPAVALAAGQTARAIVADGSGGVWALLSGPADEVVRFDMTGELDRLALPAGLSDPLTFAVDPSRNRFAFALGFFTQNELLVTVDDGSSTLAILGEAPTTNPISDIEFDPTGSLWTRIPLASAYVRYDTDGTLIRLLTGFNPTTGSQETVRVDSAGDAWASELGYSGSRLQALRGAILPPPVASPAVPRAFVVELDTKGGGVVAASDFDGFVARLDMTGNIVDRYDLSGFNVASAISVDPESGTLWIASGGASRSSLQRAAPGEALMTVFEDDAAFDVIFAIEADPRTGDVCVGGADLGPDFNPDDAVTVGMVRRYSSDGTLLWSQPLPQISAVRWISVSPDGSCLFMGGLPFFFSSGRNQHAGSISVDGSTVLIRDLTVLDVGTPAQDGSGASVLESGKDGRLYFLEHLRDNFGATIYDGVVALDLACGPGPSCFQEVIDLRADDFRNARHFVIDPIDQNFFIAVGPTAQDPSAPAILRLVIDPATGGGTVVGQVTVEIPRFVTVNR